MPLRFVCLVKLFFGLEFVLDFVDSVFGFSCAIFAVAAAIVIAAEIFVVKAESVIAFAKGIFFTELLDKNHYGNGDGRESTEKNNEFYDKIA